jgi:hypothetical protein
MMGTQPLVLSLEPLFPLFGWGRRVQVFQYSATLPEAPTEAGRVRVATIELGRRILLDEGASYAVGRLGSFWSAQRALWPTAVQNAVGTPLAIWQRERVGVLLWRYILHVGGESGTAYLIRHRSALGAPANVDVVPLLQTEQDARAAGPVLLRVERVGVWRRRLWATADDPTALPVPVVLFVLNQLAVHERAVAAASTTK